MSRFALSIFAGCLAALGMLPQSAHAVVTKTLPGIAGSAIIGMVGSSAKIVFSPGGGGSCSIITINASGGLVDTTEIHGTAANETIVALGGNTTICGQAMTPLITNGHQLRMMGFGGNDVVFGGFIGLTFGGDGDDWAGTDRAPGTASGGKGNDLVYSSAATATLNGDAGNDRLCALNASETVSTMNGGSGTDDRCGIGTFVTSNIETVGADCSYPCH